MFKTFNYLLNQITRAKNHHYGIDYETFSNKTRIVINLQFTKEKVF